MEEQAKHSLQATNSLPIDSKRILPLTSLFASANQNKKKHSLTLLEKTRQILGKSGSKLRSVITDSQYSDNKIRIAVDEAVIPHPANQKRGVENLLRVNKKFRTYGPVHTENATAFSSYCSNVKLLKQLGETVTLN